MSCGQLVTGVVVVILEISLCILRMPQKRHGVKRWVPCVLICARTRLLLAAA